MSALTRHLKAKVEAAEGRSWDMKNATRGVTNQSLERQANKAEDAAQAARLALRDAQFNRR